MSVRRQLLIIEFQWGKCFKEVDQANKSFKEKQRIFSLGNKAITQLDKRVDQGNKSFKEKETIFSVENKAITQLAKKKSLVKNEKKKKTHIT